MNMMWKHYLNKVLQVLQPASSTSFTQRILQSPPSVQCSTPSLGRLLTGGSIKPMVLSGDQMTAIRDTSRASQTRVLSSQQEMTHLGSTMVCMNKMPSMEVTMPWDALNTRPTDNGRGKGTSYCITILTSRGQGDSKA